MVASSVVLGGVAAAAAVDLLPRALRTADDVAAAGVLLDGASGAAAPPDGCSVVAPLALLAPDVDAADGEAAAAVPAAAAPAAATTVLAAAPAGTGVVDDDDDVAGTGVLDVTAASPAADSFSGVEARESPASLPLELVLSFFFGFSVPPVAVDVWKTRQTRFTHPNSLTAHIPPVGIAAFFLAEPLLACSLDTSFWRCTFASLYLSTRFSGTHSSQLGGGGGGGVTSIYD